MRNSKNVSNIHLAPCDNNYKSFSTVSSFNKFYRDESRTPKATKMEIFVSPANDSQPLIVVINNFVLDATSVLDPRDRL